jgi:hypothetical protein
MDDAAFERLTADCHEELCREALALVRGWRRRLALDGSMAGQDGRGSPDPRVEEALDRVLGDLEVVAAAWARQEANRAERVGHPSATSPTGRARPSGPAGLLPDDPDLYALFDRVERRLLRPLALIGRESPLAEGMPAPLSDAPSVLGAYRRVRAAIPPPGSACPVTAEGGRWALVGLHVLDLPQEALLVLEAAVVELSAALAAPPLRPARDATRRIVLRLAARADATPDALVGEFARIVALLHLPADRATLELRSLLEAGACDGVRLDRRQAEFYRVVAERTIPLVLDFHRVAPSLFDEPDAGR